MKKYSLIIIALFLTVGLFSQSKYSIVNKFVQERFVDTTTVQVDSIDVMSKLVPLEGPSSMRVESPEAFQVSKILTDFLDYFMSDQAFSLLDKFLNGGQCSKDRKFYEAVGKDYIRFLVEHHQQNPPADK